MSDSIPTTSVGEAASAAADDVRVEPAGFVVDGIRLAASLYLPAAASSERPGSAVVVSGAWMTVKEQMPAVYGRAMAQRGIIALTFDFRDWGDSGAERRGFESPARKIADIKAAVAWLAARPEVKTDSVGGLAICVSCGYLAKAAIESDVIKAVAFVAPWLHDELALEDAYGGASALAERRDLADSANAFYERHGLQVTVPIASLTDASALLFEAPYYTERDRGLVPEWSNRADVGFWRDWLSHDAIALAPLLRKPVLMVHSNAAALPNAAGRFLAALPEDKSAVWLDNISQFDFYDRPSPVKAAADAAADHFHERLS